MLAYQHRTMLSGLPILAEGLANRVVCVAGRATLRKARDRKYVFRRETLTVPSLRTNATKIESKCMDHSGRNHMLQPHNTYKATACSSVLLLLLAGFKNHNLWRG